MTVWLLADIGGTNARFAQASEGVLVRDSVAHYRNDDHRDFASVLSAYLAAHPGDFEACCFAVAGQINGAAAYMTNRPWQVTGEEISRQTGCGDNVLINDLYALGRSLTRLHDDDVISILSAPADHRGNGQSLVVNIGTGFNIAFVTETAQGTSSSRAEAGHSSLPLSVYRNLRDLVGARADDFPTAEHCFSGRGISNVYAAAFGTAPRPGADIIAEAEDGADDSVSADFMRAYARMLGIQLREMALSFLPTNGIYFVGSVAGGVFQSKFASSLVDAFQLPVSSAMSLPTIPLALIKSDNAGVLGCLAVLGERDPND